MSVIVLLTLKTKPDAYEEFGTILENILGDTASFEGCEGINQVSPTHLPARFRGSRQQEVGG